MDDSSRVLQTLPHMRFHAEARLLTWHPQGALDDQLLDRVVEFAEAEEAAAEQPFNRFGDLDGLTGIKLSFGHLYRVSQRRRAAYPWREPVKSAIYCSRGVGFAFAQIYAALMEGGLNEVRAFRSREAAAEWLGVPVEILVEAD